MNVILNNKVVPVEIMDTPNSISTGMMGRNHLDGGMLFIFDEQWNLITEYYCYIYKL